MIYITAIRLSAGGNTLKHITDVRWFEPSTGNRNDWPRSRMVTWIRDERGDARVKDQRGEAQVIVVEDNPPYLKASPNDRTTDNLLSLPRF